MTYIENKTENLEKNPKISVITLTYNRAVLLPRAVKSVLNQTFSDFELIIVNNASTDNTEEVVRNFRDRRIVYKRNIENKPLGGKNMGLDAAQGKYVVFLDDDDEFLPGALETISAKFEELGPKGVNIIWFDGIDAESGKFTGFGIREEGYVAYQDYLCGKITGDYQIVMAKAVIGNNRFSPDSWAGLLSTLLFKLHRDNKAFHVPKTIIKAYRQHGQSRVSDPGASLLKFMPQIISTSKAFLEEYGAEIKSCCPAVYGKNQALLGFYQILHGEKIEGRNNLRKSFKFIFSLKYCFLFLVSFILSKNQIKFLYLKFFKLKQALKS